MRKRSSIKWKYRQNQHLKLLSKEKKVPRYATAIGMLYHLLRKDVEHKSATQQQPNKNFTAGYIKIALQAFIH
jgi:hypothetical protein